MKIAVVCDILGEENNGATHAAMNFIRSLQSKGHDVNVICADQDKKGKPNYYVCPNKNIWPFNRYIKKVGVSFPKADLEIIKEGIKDADIVHIHLPFSMGNKAIKIAKKYNIPTTASFHMQAENLTSHLNLQKFGIANKLVYKFIWKHTYSHVDAIHYPTSFVRNIFEANIKHKTNGYVISNGVNEMCAKPKKVEKPEKYKEKFVILSTGRYAAEKAQDVLIKAVALSKYKDKIQLILAGQGPKRKEYERLAKKVGVNPQLGILSRKDIVDAINYCDLYVHPARFELEGIACLEAICCGKPTIVSNSKKAATSGFAVDEKCIFKNNNPKDLASKIDYYIEHEDERIALGQKYLESATRFDQRACMDEMEQMLFETVENHKKKTDKN